MVCPGHGEGDELLELPTAASVLRVGRGFPGRRGDQVSGIAEQELPAVAPVFVRLALAAQRLRPGGYSRVLAQVLGHVLRHVGPAGRGEREHTEPRAAERRGAALSARPAPASLPRTPLRQPEPQTTEHGADEPPTSAGPGPLPFITSLPPRARASFRRQPVLPGCFAATPSRPPLGVRASPAEAGLRRPREASSRHPPRAARRRVRLGLGVPAALCDAALRVRPGPGTVGGASACASPPPDAREARAAKINKSCLLGPHRVLRKLDRVCRAPGEPRGVWGRGDARGVGTLRNKKPAARL